MARTTLLLALLPLLAACASSGPSHRSSVEVIPLDPGATAPEGRIAPSLGDELAGPPWRGRETALCREHEGRMRVAAMEHGVDVGLIAGIIYVESSFRKDAVSRAGARGLMQVMPSVGRRLSCGDLFDPDINIACGITVLKRFLERYDHDLIFGLSAYNAGFRIPNEARSNNTLPRNIRYVERVLGARATYLRHGCGR